MIEANDSLVPCDRSSILIVDDENSIRTLFSKIIEMELEQLLVDTADDGDTAVARFREKHYGIILMDLHMNRMDGLEAFHTIRKYCADNAWQEPTVIFCTGFAPSGGVREIVESPGEHCLILKPVTFDKLVGTVEARL